MVARQVRYEQLAFWLNRIGAIFTVGFAVIFLELIAASAGKTKSSVISGVKLIQYDVGSFAAYGVMAACFTMLAIGMVVRRETGLLKRLRLSPLPTWALLAAIFVSAAIVAFVQVVIVLLIGRLQFNAHMPQNYLAFVVALLIGIFSFTALGVAMSTLIPNQDTAGPVTSVIFFVLMFLSGLYFPIKTSSGLAKFSNWFPVRHFIKACFAPFDFLHGASPWDWGDLKWVAIWGVIGAFVALRRFTWSPRRG
jgi:ABC-2 type transport system permease protein